MRTLSLRLQTLALLGVATGLLAAGCDIKIVDSDEPALFDLTAGPQAGTVEKADDSEIPAVDAAAVGLTDEAVVRLNGVRQSLGLRPLSPTAELTRAAQAHADVLFDNWDQYQAAGLSPHLEDRAFRGFTGQTPGDRVSASGYAGIPRGEVIAYKASQPAAMEAWLESLYHRLPLLRRELDHFGYGWRRGGDFAVNVLEVGRRDAPPWDPNPTPLVFIAYPADGTTDVPYLWKGLENPLPAPPPAGYPSGPVLTLSALHGAVEVASAAVLVAGSNRALPVTVLSKANDPYLSEMDISLIPHRPLEPASAYVVRVTGTLDGQPFEYRWQFSTRAASCDVSADDCSVGRGCYPLNGELECLWEGVTDVDEACVYVNDCAPGLTCLGSRCRPVCDSSPDAPFAASCDGMCYDNVVKSAGPAEYGVCRASETCGTRPDDCGADEGCYYAGGGFMCSWAGERNRGEACDYANDCAKGLSCLDLGAGATCHALCGEPAFRGCDDVCKGRGHFQLDEETGTQVCL